jgi:hypothetical protein
MPRTESGALIACEGFRKRSANAIEFDRFIQHDGRTLADKFGGIHVHPSRKDSDLDAAAAAYVGRC